MRENDCIGEWIIRLAQYGIEKGLLKEDDRIYMENSLADLCGLTELPRILPEEISFPLERILAELLDDVCARGRIEDTVTARDLFDTRLMGLLTPRPSEVRKAFWNAYQKDPKAATDYFYQLSQNSDYIRSYRIKKDRKWTVESPYGVLDITINLSKPEKDPKRIAKLAEQSATLKEHSYPSCQLCLENEGYAGRMDHPARQNLRVIPLSLGGEAWYLQYSPYVYYQEHCIAFCREHRPMKISRESFVRLFDFIDLFPHYFIGSNADLPIVGGSILTHDHFQGGRYEFAMERAEIVTLVSVPGYEEIEAGIVKWPLSVLRLRSSSRERLTDLAEHILTSWRTYTDEEALIYANTQGKEHNTITPIARRKDDKYELDLVLRNNRTTKEHPLGLFHPHEELHHIKKENIGLIEVMGLAVLPSRLKEEIEAMKTEIQTQGEIGKNPKTAAHAVWLKELLCRRPEIGKMAEEELEKVLEQEIGAVFVRVLEDAGVYKNTPEGQEAFRRVLNTL